MCQGDRHKSNLLNVVCHTLGKGAGGAFAVGACHVYGEVVALWVVEDFTHLRDACQALLVGAGAGVLVGGEGVEEELCGLCVVHCDVSLTVR